MISTAHIPLGRRCLIQGIGHVHPTYGGGKVPDTLKVTNFSRHIRYEHVILAHPFLIPLVLLPAIDAAARSL